MIPIATLLRATVWKSVWECERGSQITETMWDSTSALRMSPSRPQPFWDSCSFPLFWTLFLEDTLSFSIVRLPLLIHAWGCRQGRGQDTRRSALINISASGNTETLWVHDEKSLTKYTVDKTALVLHCIDPTLCWGRSFGPCWRDCIMQCLPIFQVVHVHAGKSPVLLHPKGVLLD